jgi:hypothetical protein
VISFTVFTKWWYVLPVDGPDTMMAGFPLPYVSDGWHTSLSLQIFVIELLVDLLCYFLFWFIVVFCVDRFAIKIKLHKVVAIFLLSTAGLSIYSLFFVASISDNLVYLKRPFDAETLVTGYKFVWNENQRPDNFDFDEYERGKAK